MLCRKKYSNLLFLVTRLFVTKHLGISAHLCHAKATLKSVNENGSRILNRRKWKVPQTTKSHSRNGCVNCSLNVNPWPWQGLNFIWTLVFPFVPSSGLFYKDLYRKSQWRLGINFEPLMWFVAIRLLLIAVTIEMKKVKIHSSDPLE